MPHPRRMPTRVDREAAALQGLESAMLELKRIDLRTVPAAVRRPLREARDTTEAAIIATVQAMRNDTPSLPKAV